MNTTLEMALSGSPNLLHSKHVQQFPQLNVFSCCFEAHMPLEIAMHMINCFWTSFRMDLRLNRCWIMDTISVLQRTRSLSNRKWLWTNRHVLRWWQWKCCRQCRFSQAGTEHCFFLNCHNSLSNRKCQLTNWHVSHLHHGQATTLETLQTIHVQSNWNRALLILNCNNCHSCTEAT